MIMGRSNAEKMQYTHQERKEKMIQVSLFRKNTLPYALTLLSILFELAYVVTILDHMEVNHMMGFTVFADIVILFMLFVCAVKMNVYSSLWSYMALALCAVFALRAAFIIPRVLKPLSMETEILLYNDAAAVLLFLAGISSLSVIKKRRRHILAQQGKTEVEM